MNLDDPGHYQGCIAGHEPCDRFKEGDRVIVYYITDCGRCQACWKGWIVNCTSDQRSVYGWHKNGAYAHFMLAEEYTLLKRPDELSFVDGAIVSCGSGTSCLDPGCPFQSRFRPGPNRPSDTFRG